MHDLWSLWDELVMATGRPDRVASELTDVELVQLLAMESEDERGLEKQVLRDEVLRRLDRAHEEAMQPAPPGTREEPRYSLGPG